MEEWEVEKRGVKGGDKVESDGEGRGGGGGGRGERGMRGENSDD